MTTKIVNIQTDGTVLSHCDVHKRLEMKYVYLLEHTHVYSSDEEDIKTIGIYATKEEAMAVIDKLKIVSGFNKCPQGFSIDKYKLGQTFWQEGYIGE